MRLVLTTWMTVWGLWGCVPLVELEGAPCPCEPGYRCCEAHGVCFPEAEACPTTPPPSTGKHCTSDADCGSREACHAWSVDKTPAGPQECRRRCDTTPACAADEVCQPAPHDGQPLERLSAAALCLSPNPPSGCAAWKCDACPPDRVGRTFCEGNDLYGCLASGHPRCGIICKKKLITHCNSCEESGGVITCDGSLIVPICVSHSCDRCPAGKASFCDGSTVRTCLRAAFSGDCTELCDLDEVEVCAGGCAEDGQGGAACTSQ